MSDAKATDQGEKRSQSTDHLEIKAPDAQQARIAGASDMAAVQNSRTNASDGSLRQYSGSEIAAQEASIEIISGDKLVSRKVALTEKDLATKQEGPLTIEQLSQTGAELSQYAKSNPALEPVVELRKYADGLLSGEQKDSLIKLSREQAAELSPEMRMRLENIEHKNKLITEGGLDQAGRFKLADLNVRSKEVLTSDTKGPAEASSRGIGAASASGEGKNPVAPVHHATETAKEQTQNAQDRSAQDRAVIYQDKHASADERDHTSPAASVTGGHPNDRGLPGNPQQKENSTLTNTPEGWFEAAKRISQLPLDKQLEVIGAGLKSGSDQYHWEQKERFWGGTIGAVQGIGEVAVNLAKITDFAAAVIVGDKAAAGKAGEEFGEALGKTVVGGVRLFETAQKYSYDVGYSGDYAKPFRDIVSLGHALDQKWSSLPPREQERLKTKLITELVADGAIGAGAAKTIGKASKFTEILDTIASDAGGAAASKSKKVLSTISQTIDEVSSHLTNRPRFAHATAYGGDAAAGAQAAKETAKDAMILERRLFPSKLDPARHLTPKEAAVENARLKRTDFDEHRWSKLKPEQKAEFLKEQGYIEQRSVLPLKKPLHPEVLKHELEQLKQRPIGPLEPHDARKITESIRTALKFEGGNVAIAQAEIDGKITSYAVTSGEQSFAGMVQSPTHRFFKTTEFRGYVTTAFDTEVKLLEDLAHSLSRSAKGTIYLFTERAPCKSCQSVIKDFEKMFPGIKVEVTDGKKGALYSVL